MTNTNNSKNIDDASQQFCVRWNSHLGSLGAAFPKLLAGQQFVDVTLACDGHQLHCHRLVLAACSKFFQSLLGESPCKHPIIILPRDIKLWEIQALVDFMYKGEVNVSQAGLTDLLKCAEILQIRGLSGNDASVYLNTIKESTVTSTTTSTTTTATPTTTTSIATPTIEATITPKIQLNENQQQIINIKTSPRIQHKSIPQLSNIPPVLPIITTKNLQEQQELQVQQQKNLKKKFKQNNKLNDLVAIATNIINQKQQFIIQPNNYNDNDKWIHHDYYNEKDKNKKNKLTNATSSTVATKIMKYDYNKKKIKKQDKKILANDHSNDDDDIDDDNNDNDNDNVERNGLNGRDTNDDSGNYQSSALTPFLIPKSEPLDNSNNNFDESIDEMNYSNEDDGDLINDDDDEKANNDFLLSNVVCEYDSNGLQINNYDTTPTGRRVRRSEATLRQAAECVSKGQTFQTVSDMFGIPISTIRFFMARKGILPRRKRGRTAGITTTTTSSSSISGHSFSDPNIISSTPTTTPTFNQINSNIKTEQKRSPKSSNLISLRSSITPSPSSSTAALKFDRSASPLEPPFHFANYKLPELKTKLI